MRQSWFHLACLLSTVAISSVGAEAATQDQLAAALGILHPNQELKAPTVVGTDLDGHSIRLEDFRGRVVFLNFWATWCIPCRQEMPAMERLYRDFKSRGLVVVAVNFQEDPGAVKAFVRDMKLTFPVVLDPSGAAATAYFVRGLPATSFIDRDHRVVGRAIGPREWDSKGGRAYIRALLGEKP
ncbi:MAG TPA: TlpA disulfide reductase family protein [Candidatus Methylomirabilis sp.]|nr:TlpA disulfide reductase family protein [Candidatus Methylomirabilis sp.]